MNGQLYRMGQLDEYAAEIRKLVVLFCLTREGLKKVARLTFMDGFTGDVSVRLQQLPGGNKW